MPVQSSNFLAPEYQAEQQVVERQRRIAEALLQQGMAPAPSGQMVGRFYVPQSPVQGLARMFSTYQGKRGLEGSDQAQMEIARRAQQSRAQAIAEALRAAQPTPGAPAPADELGGGPAAPAQPGNPLAAYQALAASGDPMLQQSGMAGILEQLKPKGPIKVGPGDSLVDPKNFAPVFTAPAKAEPFTLSPGGIRYDASGKQIASAPEKADEFERALKAAGIDPASPEGQRMARERVTKLSTHAPAPSVKVDVKTGESLGKEIGPMVAESRAGALGALQTSEIANRIRSSIAGGNVNVGPTATIRNTVDQLGQTMGIAGKTTEERLVNTRNVIRGLAQATIAARKQLKGQGQVSDFEGKLLQKAESGEIDNMTIPELKSFVDLSERLAKLQYGLHENNVNVMRKRKDLENLVPFYEVPQWGAFNPPSGPKPNAQQIADELRRRGVIK